MASPLQNFAFGVPASYQKVPKFGQENISALNAVRQQGLQNLQNPTQGFEPIRQRAINQYQQNIIPQLAQDYAGNNATASSGFQGALAQAGTGLAERLAAMESEYGLKNRGQALDELRLGLTPQEDYLPIAGKEGYFEKIAPSVIEAIPGVASALANYFTGGVSGAAQAVLPQIVSFLKGMFGGGQKQSIDELQTNRAEAQQGLDKSWQDYSSSFRGDDDAILNRIGAMNKYQSAQNALQSGLKSGLKLFAQ